MPGELPEKTGIYPDYTRFSRITQETGMNEGQFWQACWQKAKLHPLSLLCQQTEGMQLVVSGAQSRQSET
jgi:hypothetical protein